jgi:hypothetical protein
MNPMSKAASRPFLRLLPPHVLLVAILTALALDRWLPIVRLWHSPWGYVGGASIASIAEEYGDGCDVWKSSANFESCRQNPAENQKRSKPFFRYPHGITCLVATGHRLK